MESEGIFKIEPYIATARQKEQWLGSVLVLDDAVKKFTEPGIAPGQIYE